MIPKIKDNICILPYCPTPLNAIGAIIIGGSINVIILTSISPSDDLFAIWFAINWIITKIPIRKPPNSGAPGHESKNRPSITPDIKEYITNPEILLSFLFDISLNVNPCDFFKAIMKNNIVSVLNRISSTWWSANPSIVLEKNCPGITDSIAADKSPILLSLNTSFATKYVVRTINAPPIDGISAATDSIVCLVGIPPPPKIASAMNARIATIHVNKGPKCRWFPYGKCVNASNHNLYGKLCTVFSTSRTWNTASSAATRVQPSRKIESHAGTVLKYNANPTIASSSMLFIENILDNKDDFTPSIFSFICVFNSTSAVVFCFFRLLAINLKPFY